MFLDSLRQELLKNKFNYYTDNYDYTIFGHKKPAKKVLINQLKRIFFSAPFLTILIKNDFLFRKFFLSYLFKYDKYIQPLEFFYANLASEKSKDLLVQLTAFRLLGYVKVRLPLSNNEYWKGMQEMEQMKNEKDFIDVPSFPWRLYLFDVSKTGFPIKVYINTKGSYTTFVVKQYIETSQNKRLAPHEGDVVIDLGGCYGDTALQFSYMVGNKGKVYTYEFIPGNLNIFKKNLALNPALKDAIEVIEHPVWDSSDKKVYYKDAGAGSHISFEPFKGNTGETTTLTVDDFVKNYNIEKVNFIKADIEGAEPYAIKGAINTLKKFTPTLAFTIYHSMNDFTSIVKQIADLNLGYKFYLGHYTIYASETVLYAVKE